MPACVTLSLWKTESCPGVTSSSNSLLCINCWISNVVASPTGSRSTSPTFNDSACVFLCFVLPEAHRPLLPPPSPVPTHPTRHPRMRDAQVVSCTCARRYAGYAGYAGIPSIQPNLESNPRLMFTVSVEGMQAFLQSNPTRRLHSFLHFLLPFLNPSLPLFLPPSLP